MTQCKDDPRASHGFLRNESHNAGEYVCECEYWQSPFEQWYNGMIGFHINSERILDDLGVHESDAHLVRRWMVVCWNNALDAAANTAWEINQPPSEEACFIADAILVLKEPLDKVL